MECLLCARNFYWFMGFISKRDGESAYPPGVYIRVLGDQAVHRMVVMMMISK